MNKLVIIINGQGGAGKDTLCEFAGEAFKITNISAITPIKAIASQHGWNGEKDPKSRKFLADLKQAFVDYNDLPNKYLVTEYETFLQSHSQILFAQIRECKEIDKFRQSVQTPCITLLIRRDGLAKKWGNGTDDNVEHYTYDYVYDNNRTLEEAKKDFIMFLQDIWDSVTGEAVGAGNGRQKPFSSV